MSTTTVRAMIEALEQIAEKYGDDTQVLAAHQPNYPLAENVSALVVTRVQDGRIVDDEADADCCGYDEGCDEPGVVVTEDAVRCVRHAEADGIDIMAATMDATPVLWVLLDGHPDNYGDSAWTSPYATSSLWSEGCGESFSL